MVSTCNTQYREALSLLQKESSSFSSICEQSLLTWLPPPSPGEKVSKKGICLIRKGENYQVHVIDYLFHTIVKEVSLDLPQELIQQPEQKIIDYLKKFTVSAEGMLEITEKLSGYPVKRCGRYGHQELSLRSSKGRILWFLYNSSKNSVGWLDASVEDEKILHGIPEKERQTFFDDYGVEVISRDDQQLQKVFLTKSLSKLDPTKTINKDFWAITLISAGASSETDLGCGHAKIIYETFKRGSHELWYADLSVVRGEPTIRHLPLSAPIKWRKKSPTWIRPRIDVEVMIKMIEQGQKNSIQFVQTGNPAFLNYLLSQPRCLAKQALLLSMISAFISIIAGIGLYKQIQEEWRFERKNGIYRPQDVPKFEKWIAKKKGWERDLVRFFSDKIPLREKISNYMKLLPLTILFRKAPLRSDIVIKSIGFVIGMICLAKYPSSSSERIECLVKVLFECLPLTVRYIRPSLWSKLSCKEFIPPSADGLDLELPSYKDLYLIAACILPSLWSMLSYKEFIAPPAEGLDLELPSYNCLTWAVKTIRLAGVPLPVIDTTIAVPNSYIQSLSRVTWQLDQQR